jgi:cysteine desulfurase
MNRFYFDHNATTPIAPEVVSAMTEAMGLAYGNPSSIHREGQQARQVLETARLQVAAFLGASPPEIVFTSGGTEADNLAITGLLRGLPVGRKHLITTAVEHPAVLESCRQAEREGVEVTYVPVDANARVNPWEVRRSIRPETVLISVMHANNETGTVQPLTEIAGIVREIRATGQTIYFHSDGVQAAGRIPADVSQLGVDLYSLSAHKMHGPKGVGALYVRKGVPLRGVQVGGRHERERRAGTENAPGIVGFARALRIAQIDPPFEALAALRNRFEAQVCSGLGSVTVNSAHSERLPNTSNLDFDGIEGEALLISLDLKGFAVSTGSACSSGSIEPSHVLLAMGLSNEEARRCVRFSFGRYNTPAEVEALAEAVIRSVLHLRKTRAARQFAIGGFARA